MIQSFARRQTWVETEALPVFSSVWLLCGLRRVRASSFSSIKEGCEHCLSRHQSQAVLSTYESRHWQVLLLGGALLSLDSVPSKAYTLENLGAMMHLISSPVGYTQLS